MFTFCFFFPNYISERSRKVFCALWPVWLVSHGHIKTVLGLLLRGVSKQWVYGHEKILEMKSEEILGLGIFSFLSKAMNGEGPSQSEEWGRLAVGRRWERMCLPCPDPELPGWHRGCAASPWQCLPRAPESSHPVLAHCREIALSLKICVCALKTSFTFLLAVLF